MGNSQSETTTSTSVDTNTIDNDDGTTTTFSISPPVGYRVLGVQSQSPASYTDLVAHFDFIVAANGVPLQTLDTTFIEIIRTCEEKPLALSVFSTKNRSLREVVLVPSRQWPGEGLLGATIRFDSFQDCDDQVVHVLGVEAGSPAEIAGLKPEEDYLLGTLEKAFKDADALFDELQANVDRPIEIFVYNSAADTVRVCVIMPTRDWGGEGLLGADVAHGVLHRLPLACCATIGKSFEVPATQQDIVPPAGVPVAPVATQPSESAPALRPATILAEEAC